MSVFYKSTRVGKNGKDFIIYKFKTLKNGSDRNQFVNKESYTFLGRFLRKTKLDELPALWNVLKGDMGIFGYRPEEKRTWELFPEEVKSVLMKHKPGFIDLASVHFFDEEKILQQGVNPERDYWSKIFPMKMTLRAFYFENKSFLLKVALLYIVMKKMFSSLWTK